MQVQRFANQCRIDEVVVDLGEDEIKSCGLQCDDRIFRGSQQRAECRGYGRAEDRKEFADAGDRGKDGGIGQSPQRKVQEHNACRKAADDELAANIGAQGFQNLVEEAQDTDGIIRRESRGQIFFDGFPVFQQIKRNKENENDVNDFAEQGQQKRQ